MQIATVAHRHGASGRALATAVAVALAESGGNASAHNPVPPDDSWGLWQVNMIGALGPARRKQFGLSNNAQLADPDTNARAAAAISGGWKHFGAWTTFITGAYLVHWPAASHAAQQVAGGRLAQVPTDTAAGGGGAVNAQPVGLPNPFHAALSVEHFFADLANPHTWLRVVYVVGGMALLTIGVFMVDADLAKKAGSFVGGSAIGTKVAGAFAAAPEVAETAAVAAV